MTCRPTERRWTKSSAASLCRAGFGVLSRLGQTGLEHGNHVDNEAELLSPVAYYLEMFRKGDTDNAFHGLLEINRDILPELMAVFRVERNVGVRELLVEVIWEYREQSVIPFLAEAL